MTAPSLLILGTDVVLVASPASPVQLAHACLAAGYDTVVPATWGEELVAARVLDRLREANAPIVSCSCPLVARRLAAHGSSIATALLALVPPPVAAARYLRALCAPARPTITFAGGCAVAGHEEIDVAMSPHALMRHFAERGIDLRAQPTEFDSVLPPDRRRFFSEPGGVPARTALSQLSSPVEFLEIDEEDPIVEVAQRLLTPSPVLIDVAPAMGCACIGAGRGVRADIARARIRHVEPPRSNAPIVDHSVTLSLEGALRALADVPATAGPNDVHPPMVRARDAIVTPAPPPRPSTPSSSEAVVESSSVAVEVLPRRTPPGVLRAVLGTMPHARSDAGRQLPRAYIARRRSSPRGLRESGVRRAQPEHATVDNRRFAKWLAIAGAGLAAGLVLAWLLLVV